MNSAGGNRSLQRGVEILRAFRQGIDVLGNGEIAERTGIPRATVSRLTRTLVQTGMLDDVRSERAYRLAATVISFGHAMRMSSPILNALGPMMRAESMRRKMNVGLAAADRSMMVYLESVRFNPRVALRNVVAGQQVPMELTSLGRAYLAGHNRTGTRQTACDLQAARCRRNAKSARRGAKIDPVRQARWLLRRLVAARRSGCCDTDHRQGAAGVRAQHEHAECATHLAAVRRDGCLSAGVCKEVQ